MAMSPFPACLDGSPMEKSGCDGLTPFLGKHVDNGSADFCGNLSR